MADSPIVTRLFHRLPESIQETIRGVLKRSEFLLLLRFYFGKENILRRKGWFDSEKRGVPVDETGSPTPWYTYSMIDFLDRSLSKQLHVFEYGAGYSTFWYAERVRTVVSVEDSEEWVETVAQGLPENGDVIFRPTKRGYIKEVSEHSKFDIIVIDGSHRRDCIKPAIKALSNEGIIIWDDFERLVVNDYIDLLDNGFSLLPFYGLKPLGAGYSSTAIFYREGNCLKV